MNNQIVVAGNAISRPSVLPWTGVATEVASESTSEAAIIRAGMDWEVNTRPLYAGVTDDSVEMVEDFRSLVRADTSKVLGVVKGRYVPIQNREAFAIFDDIVGAGNAEYHTVGSLNHGKLVWIQAKLPGLVRIDGTDDVTEQYILLSNTHDGTRALRIGFVPFRIVCHNMLNMAFSHAKKTGQEFSIRHTINADQRIEEAKRVLIQAHNYYRTFNQLANVMARTPYSEKMLEEMTSEMFPANDNGDVATRTQNNRNKVIELFSEGRGQREIAKIRGTAWAAYNGVTEFADWHRSTRTGGGKDEAAARFEANVFGSGRALKQGALDLILAQTGIKIAA